MKAAAFLAGALLLAGCATPHPIVDMGQGVAAELAAEGRPSAVACPVRLAALVDGRSEQDRAGVVWGMDARLADALPLLEAELHAAGIRRDATGPLQVRVTLKKFYLSQIHETKTPNLVLAWAGADGREQVLRAHDTSIVWSGGPEGFQRAMARVMRRAVDQLSAELGRQCPAA